MHKYTTRIRIIIIGYVTLITGTFWIASELYHQYVSSTLSEEAKAQISSFNPQLQTRILDELAEKRQIDIPFEGQMPDIFAK
jgi:hypothetical protein